MTKLEQMAREIVAEAMKDFEPKEYPFIQGLLIEMGRAVIALIANEMTDSNPEDGLKSLDFIPVYEFMQSLDKLAAKPTEGGE